ncbi:SEC-C domain-containing protein [Methylococcus sp. Mc7]|nr:SEC-C domain-containing protein [Methylococcus sp. Mc7]
MPSGDCSEPMTGTTSSCPCGSGRKFKHCCTA